MAPYLTETDSPCPPESTLCFRLLLLMCVVSNLFHHRPLSATESPFADPGRRQGKGLKKNVLGTRSGKWIGKPVKSPCPKLMNAWKRRKHKMERASRGPWIEYEHSPRARQLREYTLKNVWESSWMTDPFEAEAINRQVNVQSQAVFSDAMTLMDKIRVWEDEESWVGSKFAACMWICTKDALTRGQILDKEQEEYLKKRIMSIMLCTNWVCAGTFVDHEWVSSRTNIQQEEEISSMALEYKIEVPCVVHWSLLWFPAPTNLNRILGSDLKIKKVSRCRQKSYHARYVRPFSGERTPESCMLTSVNTVHTMNGESTRR